MNILEDLWLGSIVPIEDALPQTAEYQRTLHQLIEDQDALWDLLPEEKWPLFTSYGAGQIKLQDLAERAAFAQGFRLGAKLMLAVLEEERV